MTKNVDAPPGEHDEKKEKCGILGNLRGITKIGGIFKKIR